MLRHVVKVVSAAELAERGPLVDVVLRSDVDATPARGGSRATHVTMLVDTGATRTLIDERIPVSMGVVPTRHETIVGVSGAAESRLVFPMVLQLSLRDHMQRIYVADFHRWIIGISPRLDDHHGYGLVGRDVLSDLRLDYDGVRGVFTLIDEHTPANPEHAKSDEEARRVRVEARRIEKRRRKAERRARRSRDH